MAVTADLTAADTRSVAIVSLAHCGCSPELFSFVGIEQVPVHLLDLAALAEPDEQPRWLPCPQCGRPVQVTVQASLHVPQEDQLPALAYVRPAGEEPSYVLLPRGRFSLCGDLSCEAPAAELPALECLAALADPALWLPVDGSEEALVEAWGRPLSMHAYLRGQVADLFAGDNDTVLLQPAPGISYVLLRARDNVREAIEAFLALASEAGLDPATTIMCPLSAGTGQAGSIIENLGPQRDRCAAELAIFGLAELAPLRAATQDALEACAVEISGAEGEGRDEALHVEYAGLTAALPLAQVALCALAGGTTLTEAAALEAQRLRLKLEAANDAVRVIGEIAGEQAQIESATIESVEVRLPGVPQLGVANLASLLPKFGWSLDHPEARARLGRMLGVCQDLKGCSCGQARPLAHLRPDGCAASTGYQLLDTVEDDRGSRFELVVGEDCEHLVRWLPAGQAPSRDQLDAATARASFQACVAPLGLTPDAARAAWITGDWIATMLAHPTLARRLARTLASRLCFRTLEVVALTSDALLVAEDADWLEAAYASLLSAHPHDLPGEPLGYLCQISCAGPAAGTLRLRWLPDADHHPLAA